MGRLLRRDNDGEFLWQEDDGQTRPATDDEKGRALLPVLNEQGVSLAERLIAKNLTNSPDQAKQYLRSIGYFVRPYGSGFNFAVQKGQSDGAGGFAPPDPTQWRVVDPSGGSDFLRDILDFSADIIGGAITGAATVAGGTAGAAAGGIGALPGAALAGAGAGAATEAARQGLGRALGVPGEFSPGLIAGVGALSGAGPIVGKGIGSAVRGARGALGFAGREAADFAARIPPLKAGATMTAGEVLRERARTMPHTIQSLLDSKDITRKILGTLKHTGKARVDEIVAQAGARGVEVDVAAPIRTLFKKGPRNILTGEAKEKFIQYEESFRAMLGAPADIRVRGVVPIDVVTGASKIPVDFTTVKTLNASVDVANELKLILQDVAADARFYANNGLAPQNFENQVGKSAVELRKILENALGGPDSEFARLNARLSEELTTKLYLERQIGGGIRPDGKLLRTPSPGEKESGEAFIANLFGKTKGEARRAVEEFDTVWQTQIAELWEDAVRGTPAEQLFEHGLLPTRLVGQGRLGPRGQAGGLGLFDQAFVGSQFNARGAPTLPSVGPRFTATGGVFGASLLGGGIAAGGPLGAAAGLGAGLTVASPRGLVGITRALSGQGRIGVPVRAAAFGGRVIEAASGAFKTKTGAVTGQIFNRAILRELFPNNPSKGVVQTDAKRRRLEEGE